MCREEIISVIVPVFKVEDLLPRCVDSILNQTYGYLEVILVDDGSPDGSGKLCDAYAMQDPRVRVIHKANGGLSSARNAGLDVATGEYVAFVDSDDWLIPEAYEWMLDAVKRYAVKLVCAGRYDVDEDTGEMTVGLCPEKEEVISGEELVGRMFAWDHCDSSACDKLYHRSLFENHRYPEGVVCEDLPVTYHLALEAGKVALLDKPVYHYYHRSGSITTAVLSEKTFHYSQHTQEIYRYIQENHPNISRQARFLRVRSLYHLLVTLEQAPREERKHYKRQIRQARRELRGHVPFLVTYPMNPQEKLTDILLAAGIYRLLRPIFHREG